MNNIENSICDAIDILVKQAINSANFDKTIQATIITCSEPSTGEYLVKYQDSKFYAYASNPDITYNSGALVHLLIPEGDFSNHKTIIGAVKNLGANYNSQITQEDQYNEIGNNCVKILDNFAGWSLCSYESPEIRRIMKVYLLIIQVYRNIFQKILIRLILFQEQLFRQICRKNSKMLVEIMALYIDQPFQIRLEKKLQETISLMLIL